MLKITKTAEAAGNLFGLGSNSLLENIVTNIVNPAMSVLVGLGLLMFLWGVYDFLKEGDNEKKRAEGKQHMIYGLVGLGIMVAVFGIMNIIIEFVESVG